MSNGLVLSQQQKGALCAQVTDQEIYARLSVIDNDKAPGIDGYNAYLFKKAWMIFKEEVSQGVKEYFITGKLYKAINCTTLTLVPKIPSPNTVKDYR